MHDLLQLTAARVVDVSPVTILPSPHSVRLLSVPLHPGRLTHGVLNSALTLVTEAPEKCCAFLNIKMSWLNFQFFLLVLIVIEFLTLESQVQLPAG